MSFGGIIQTLQEFPREELHVKQHSFALHENLLHKKISAVSGVRTDYSKDTEPTG